VNGLTDTAVLVDVLRSQPPAIEWLTRQDALGITSISWLEIIEGATDDLAQKRAVRLLRHVERICPSADDCDWAIQRLLQLRLSHGVDAMDCFSLGDPARIEHASSCSAGSSPERSTNQLSRYFRDPTPT
jgi:predicted nucleic acid-binding protein